MSSKSKWARGVQIAAGELLEKLKETGRPAAALTAEKLWERLIAPDAVPVTAQNRAETWLGLQARALHQAMESLAARRIVWNPLPD